MLFQIHHNPSNPNLLFLIWEILLNPFDFKVIQNLLCQYDQVQSTLAKATVYLKLYALFNLHFLKELSLILTKVEINYFRKTILILTDLLILFLS